MRENGEYYTMSVKLDREREAYVKADEPIDTDSFDEIMAKLNYRTAASRNLRAQLKTHRDYLKGAIDRLGLRLPQSP